MVSYAVTYLYTNIPVNEAVQIVIEKLYPTLSEKKVLSRTKKGSSVNVLLGPLKNL